VNVTVKFTDLNDGGKGGHPEVHINHDTSDRTYTKVTFTEAIGRLNVLVSTFTVMSSDKISNEHDDNESRKTGTDDNWNQHVHLVFAAAVSCTNTKVKFNCATFLLDTGGVLISLKPWSSRMDTQPNL